MAATAVTLNDSEGHSQVNWYVKTSWFYEENMLFNKTVIILKICLKSANTPAVVINLDFQKTSDKIPMEISVTQASSIVSVQHRLLSTRCFGLAPAAAPSTALGTS